MSPHTAARAPRRGARIAAQVHGRSMKCPHHVCIHESPRPLRRIRRRPNRGWGVAVGTLIAKVLLPGLGSAIGAKFGGLLGGGSSGG